MDCISEGARGSRRAATVFGGRVTSGAVVTWLLVGLNVALYLVEWIYPPIVWQWEMIGARVGHGESYRLVTSAFLHYPGLGGFGPAHLIFNMWALIVVGPALERMLGHLRYLAVYLLSAAGGAVLFYLLADPRQPALGASGAIFGLFAAWFVVARRQRLDSRGIVALIVINLAISFLVPDIAWQAHVGGLIVGGLLTAAYAYVPRERRALVQPAATAAVVAVLVIAVLSHQASLI